MEGEEGLNVSVQCRQGTLWRCVFRPGVESRADTGIAPELDSGFPVVAAEIDERPGLRDVSGRGGRRSRGRCRLTEDLDIKRTFVLLLRRAKRRCYPDGDPRSRRTAGSPDRARGADDRPARRRSRSVQERPLRALPLEGGL